MTYKAPEEIGFPEVTFRNHQQLDAYVEDLLAAFPRFRTKYPHDIALLKAFGTYTKNNNIE